MYFLFSRVGVRIRVSKGNGKILKENQKTNDLPFLSKMVRCYFFIKKQRFISKIPPYKRNLSLIMF